MQDNITYELDVNNLYNNLTQEDYTKKSYNFNCVDYEIIKYNKDRLKFYLENDFSNFLKLKDYRSIIFRNNKLLVFSPPKSVDYEYFENKYKNLDDCWLEDFIDGTMINLFYDTTNNCWEITTKSNIGGNNLFFKDNNNIKKTFKEMFFEACNLNNFNVLTLPTTYTYCFILQHPANRIVTPNDHPKIFLIKIYDISIISDLKYKITEINTINFANTPPYIFLNTGIQIACKYKLESYETVNKKYYNSLNIPFYCVGIMIYNKDGSRTKVRNENYEYVRKLRGNQPKLQYNYLCLKKENKVKEFLFYYPEHKNEFNVYKDLMYNYTNNLYVKYIECFIKKEKQLKEFEFEYKIHMFKLHEKYKNDLLKENKKIDKKVVINYINSLHPAQQMFVINYSKKNNNIENNFEETMQIE